MNRSSVVRGLLSLSVLGIGLVAAGIAVAAGWCGSCCPRCLNAPRQGQRLPPATTGTTLQLR